MEQYDAFILAGARAPWLKPLAGTEHILLAKAGNVRLVDLQLGALNASGKVRQIVLAALPDALKELENTLPPGVGLCEAKDDLPASACSALAALGPDASSKVLGICDDIPLITPLALQDFFNQCERYPQSQICYPIIPKAACLRAFPGAQRTYGRLKEGYFTGGNMMLLTHDAILEGQHKAREIFERRKSPLKLCDWLGWGFIFKLILHQLSVEAAEKQTSRLLGLNCKAIVTEHAEIGMDIDKPADWTAIGSMLSSLGQREAALK